MERVGVRGPFHKLRLAERPLTRNLREERANSDLSPQAGRGEGCGQIRLPSKIRFRFVAHEAQMPTIYDFRDRVAVVTGGAQGIGRAIAARLLHDGARVWLWDRDAAL